MTTNSGLALPRDELILPPGIERISEPDEAATAADKGSALPKPTGFHLLCIAPDAKAQFADSVLVKAEQTMADEVSGTNVLFVLDVGPDAYSDKARFPSGSWCAKGDFILVRRYAGTRFKVFGKEFRVINDDQVEAVVSDPRGVSPA
jgi:co-chaperonin GroES (HSP10)